MTSRAEHIQKIVQMVRDVDLSNLAQAQAKREMIAAAKNEILTELAKTPAIDDQDLTFLSPAALHWKRWCDGQLRALSIEEAKLADQTESLRGVAQKSFARANALQMVIEKQKG